MRRFAHTFYLVIIAVLATLLYVEHSKQPDTAPPQAVQQTETSEEIQASLNDLSQRLADLQTQVERQSTTEHQSPPSSYQVSSQPASDGTQAQQNIDSQVSLSQNQLRRRLESESIDPDWSYQQEDNIRELFAQDQYLQNLQLNDLRCRRTLCELQIQELDNQQPINNLYLHQAIIDADWMPHERLLSFQQEDSSYLYIFRN